jgi:hypothetical protein
MIDRIKETYDYDEPIVLKNLDYSDLSYSAKRNALKRLVDKGDLQRYAKGVYYLPRETIFGQSILSMNEAVISKYIKDKKNIYGFFAGYKLLNELDLTTQVPNTFEVISNRVKTDKRVTQIGKRRVILKKSIIPVTKENEPILKLVNLINYKQFSNLNSVEKKQIMIRIGVNENNIQLLNSMVRLLPKDTSVKIIESGVINAITS